jgi:hypothetical protein
MNNNQLHEEAVRLLLDRQRNATETNAKGCVKSYNQRRKQATAELQPILSAIWDALKRGESVGGFTSKEDWASSQSITIRQIQRIISGTPQKRHDVALKVGMTVTVDGAKVVLTQALINLLIPKKKAFYKVGSDSRTLGIGTKNDRRAQDDDELKDIEPHYVVGRGYLVAFTNRNGKPEWTPMRYKGLGSTGRHKFGEGHTTIASEKLHKLVKPLPEGMEIPTEAVNKTRDRKVWAVKPTTILHAKKTGWGDDGTLCNTPLTFHDGVTGPSDEANNVATGKSVNCTRCLEKRAEKSKKTAETRAALKTVRNDPAVRAFLAEEATV